MAIYEEKQPLTGKSILLLIFAFAAIYFPLQLGDWELRWKEDRFATIASEMDLMHPYTIAHGEQVPLVTPIFPWLTAALHQTGLSFEFCLRLISVASLAALIILTWEAGKRANDLQTAVVSAAMMCSSIVIIEKATDGYPNLTGLLFLFSAWLAWFTFGVARGRWNIAWIISFFFCSMAFLTIGCIGIILFIVPLIFMRRPMTVWPKMTKPGFFLGVMLLLFVILIWVVPRIMLADHIPFRDIDLSIDSPAKYTKHLLTFPLAIISRYFPWSFIAWPAFCVAYFPLDKNPIFSRFLRTIVISIFFLLWLSPTTDARDFIYIAPPLAILCGINYWLLVRRHGYFLHTLFRYFLYLTIAIATVIIIFYFLPDSILLQMPYIKEKNIAFRTGNTIAGILQAAIALIITLIVLRFKKGTVPIYANILFICLGGALCFWAVHIPYRKQHTEKKDLGTAFRNILKEDLHIAKSGQLPKDLTVFKGPGIKGFYAPCIYMGTRVKKVHKLTELPDNLDTIYMITRKFPVSAKRKWVYVTPKEKPHIYKDDKFYILKGIKIREKEKK